MTRVADLKIGTADIEAFLIEYLGTPSQPAPFGGRAAELASLNAWLVDPHASPYALLSGRAGSGKSALLAHWANSLAQQGQTQVIFYPICPSKFCAL
jgi:hypothetical protein